MAHLHGGEITEGAYDDSIRHAITKLSSLHFVASSHGPRKIMAQGGLRYWKDGREPALKPYDAETRRQLVAKAAREVWAFFVQRELCGLRDQKDVIRHYGIPNEVLARLGAVEKRQR